MENYLKLKVSRTFHEEICIDGSFTIYCKLENMALPIPEALALFYLLPLCEGNKRAYRLLPYYNSLSEASHLDNTEESKYKCKLCTKLFDKNKMRQHVGSHIGKRGSAKCLRILWLNRV